MTDRVRFHLDEHVAFAVAAGLRKHGIDVTTTQEAGLIGADDSTQLEYALRERRVMVTHDAVTCVGTAEASNTLGSPTVTRKRVPQDRLWQLCV